MRDKLYSLLEHCTRANIVDRVIVAAELCILNVLARSGCVNKCIVANINAYVADFVACIGTGEEYQIAGLELGLVYLLDTLVILIIGASLDADAKMVVYVYDQSGAVKTVGSGAAPQIGTTEECCGIVADLLAKLSFFFVCGGLCRLGGNNGVAAVG